ncbi:MAG: YfhO family protein, partial [Clostridia bacterium]|nr:YfhO family protein [Clostridia bacterium]
ILSVCFLLPALMMTIVYFCLLVWPLGQHSVLVLDLNAQYVYYFEKLRNILVSGDSLLYSFERALGGEFMGIFAYYLSSPLSFLVALLPKTFMTESIFLLLVIKTGLCGATFGYYLIRTRLARPVWTVLFSSMYAMCSYMVVMQHNIMWIDNVILFPLILFGMDMLIKEGRFRLYVGALALAVLSNFFIGYMTCLFLAVYFFIRYASMTEEERGLHWGNYAFWKALFRMVAYSLLAVALAAVIILPAYYSLSFGKLDFSEPNYEPEQLYDFFKMLTKVYFGSYDSVRPTGMPFLYGGMLVPVLLPLYFITPGIRLRHKAGNLAALIFLLLGLSISTLDIVWHGLQRPNWLNARFAFMFVFLAIVMAYDAFVRLKETGVKKIIPSCIFSAFILILMQALDYINVNDFFTVWSGVVILCVLGALVPYALRDKEPGDTYLYSNPELFLVAFVIFELIANGVLMVYYLDSDVTFTNRAGYRTFVDRFSDAAEELEEYDDEKYGEDSFYRAEKTKHRKKNDNFAIDINGLTNSTSTLNAKSITFLKQMGLSARSHWSMYYGGNPATDSLLGLRYVMADTKTDSDLPAYLTEMYEEILVTEEEITIWENPYDLGLAFTVNDAMLTYAEYNEDADRELEENEEPFIRALYEDAVEYKTPFQMMNHMFSAMLGREVEIFTPVDARETETKGVDPVFTMGHTGYELDGSGLTPKIVYEMEIEEDLPVYVYFPSEHPRDAEIKLDSDKLGDYFTDDTFSIQELGVLEPGEHTFTLYLEEDNIFIASGCKFFWYFHEDVFKEAIAVLQQGKLDAVSERDDVVSGTITAAEDRTTVFTTIPYDEGWKVYVDGEEVEIVCLMDAMVGFSVTAGEHEIVMKYRPAYVKYGLLLSLASLAVYAGLSYRDMRRRYYNYI